MAPSTFGGRLFCIFYALCGIPLCMLALKSIGERINELLENGFILISSKHELRQDKSTKVKVMLSTAGLVLVLLLLGGLLYLSEGWSYFDGVYYCFIGKDYFITFYSIDSRGAIKFSKRERPQSPMVQADRGNKSFRQNFFHSRDAGLDLHFYRQCYKTIPSCFQLCTVELWCTREVWRALKKQRLELLSAKRFFRALQTSRLHHNSIVHAKA